MASGISWKEFEAIIYRLQRTFNKAGTVTRDEKLREKNLVELVKLVSAFVQPSEQKMF
jgi:hypothetical protein